MPRAICSANRVRFTAYSCTGRTIVRLQVLTDVTTENK